MSYHDGYKGQYNGGGRRGHNYRREREHHQPAPERPESQLRSAVIKLADNPDSDPVNEIARLANYIRDHLPGSSAAIAEGLRIGITEQPYKIPYYATLVAYLVVSVAKESGETTGLSPTVKVVLDDFVRGFQTYLDELKWLQLRLCIHFFAHLTALNIIVPSTLLSLLQSFITVIDEPGVSYYRARAAARCAGEALLRAGSALNKADSTAVNEIISSIKVFADSQDAMKTLVAPIVRLHEKEDVMDEDDEFKETLFSLVKALTNLQGVSFLSVPPCLPQPYRAWPMLDSLVSSEPEEDKMFSLGSFLVPPDPMELDGEDIGAALGPVIEDGKPTPAAKSEVPSVYLKLFDDDITPNDASPAGYLVRTCLQDMLEIFEINRKDCARLLLEYPRWWEPLTFRGRHADEDNMDGDDVEPMDWTLECLAVETTLGTAFLLPQSPHLNIYYFALITDLCKLSPSTVGPAVGKSIRSLYKLLEDPSGKDAGALDVEVARRFSSWFALHMSNFNFNWVWKEWIPDLSLTPHHPRHRFIHRAIELEIRAAYFDRIKETLPVEYHDPSVGAMPAEAPGPSYEYEDESHPHYAEADSLLQLIRKRSKVDEVLVHAQGMVEQVATTTSLSSATTIVRSISTQVILHVGSRSFSHFLNAIERYLALLRFFSKETDAKADVLDNVARFWKRHSQMVAIVFDKLMQYQIVDPADVVAWSFRTVKPDPDSGPVRTQGWEILKAALDKASGRVAIAKYKVQKVKKDDEDAKGRMKARAAPVDGVELEMEDTLDEDTTESPALAAALKAHSTLTRDQKTALVRALDGFVAYLGSSTAAAVLSKEAWYSREHWGEEEWDAWETWGWFRHFCRAYSSQLKTYLTTLEGASLAKLDTTPDVDPNASAMVKFIWNQSLGGD